MSSEEPVVLQTICPRDYDVFGGLDVDKRRIAVTFLDHGGMLKSFSIPYDPEHLIRYTRKHFPGQKVAFVYEAGPTGYGLYDRLSQAGYTCLVAAPSMVPVQPGARVKTNRLDSVKLDRSLRGGEIKGIRVPGGSYRELRHLTQLRQVQVRHLAADKCRIKALLTLEGISFPEAPAGGHWSSRIIQQLKGLSCSPAVQFKLHRLIESLEFHRLQALRTLQEIRRLCRDDPELADSLRYLTSLPGIGEIVASNALARIGDWRQLQNAQEIGAFLGLVPREKSTGQRVEKGPITRSGDPALRNMLIEASWSAIRQDDELAAFYRRVYQRHPRDRAARKAIVAVARKLTLRMYAVLKERRVYQKKPLTP